jgi:hypothetical protein
MEALQNFVVLSGMFGGLVLLFLFLLILAGIDRNHPEFRQ